MCGIHGIVSLRDQSVPDPAVLTRMGNVTVHRGPDDEGSFVGPGVGLGMRRLSIIDLAGGHQPITNHDGSLVMVCNGEIYNYRELRAELAACGHRFKTDSDSEVVLYGYAEWGDRFVERLNGMFAFAIWDKKQRRTVIGRDRLGIKPVYYLNDGERLTFSTEAKAILECPWSERALDPAGLEAYLSLGYVPGPLTLFKGMRKLPVASLMVVKDGDVSIRSYWSPPENTESGRSEEEWATLVREQLEKSIEMQMVSDVPIGAFLSGGIDSSAIVAYMAKHSSRPVNTYAIGFDGGDAEGYYNELPYARQVAEMFGTKHREIVVKPDVARLLPKLLWHMDEPIADAAFITTYLVAEFARQDVTVILSGCGGDELFGGYRRYLGEHYGARYRRLPRWLRRGLIEPVARRLPSDRHSKLLNLFRYARGFLLSADLSFEERYRSYVGVYTDEALDGLLNARAAESYDAIGAAFETAQDEDPIKRMFKVDLATQLPDDLLVLTDKMTMATSLECRVPFLDHELVELAARMPGSMAIRGRNLKHILKRALKGVLPDDILYRKKRGFGAPMGAWIKKELQPVMKALLSRDVIEGRGLFRWEAIEETVAMHESNREDCTDHLLSLMNLEIWMRLFLDGDSPEVVTEQLSGALVPA